MHHFERAVTARIPQAALILLIAAGASPAAPAQSVGAPEELGLQEIIVTAQRRTENLREVPISVSTVSEETLQALHLTSSADLQFTTPGLVIPTDTGVATPYIRGVGSGYSGPGLEGSVAVYLNDIYIESQSVQLQNLLDVKQIEVVKGPQGVLYGRNATGGAVLIATNDPDPSKLSGHLEGDLGNLQTQHAELVLNMPITDTLAFRLASAYDQQGAYIRNVSGVAGATLSEGEFTNDHVRGSLGWTPTTDFSAVGSVDWQRRAEDQVRQQRSIAPFCVTCAIFGDKPALGFYTTTQADLGPITTNDLVASLHLKYRLADLQLEDFTSYQFVKSWGCTDLGLTASPFLLYCQAPFSTSKTYTEELRASSQYSGPLNFAAGINYLRNDSNFSSSLGGSAFGGFGPGIGVNTVTTDSYAGYAEGYWDFVTNWKLTAGARYTVDRRSFGLENNAFAAAALAGGVASFNSDAKSHGLTPRVVLQYTPGKWDYYISYDKGYKSGGFFLPSFSPVNSVGPETIDAVELGVKTSLDDGRLNLNLAYYHYKWKDMQVTDIDPVTSFQSLVNAGAASANGVESGGQFIVTRGLTVSADLAWAKGKYDEFDNASVLVPSAAGFIGGSVNLSGYRLPNMPEFSGNIGVNYKTKIIGGWNWDITAAERLTTDYDFFAGAGGPARQDRQGGYAIGIVSTTFATPDDQLGVTFSVNNVTDKQYAYQTGTTGYGVYSHAAEPRIYRAGVRFNF
jgi:iron complex outermembrane recepter protein